MYTYAYMLKDRTGKVKTFPTKEKKAISPNILEEAPQTRNFLMWSSFVGSILWLSFSSIFRPDVAEAWNVLCGDELPARVVWRGSGRLVALALFGVVWKDAGLVRGAAESALSLSAARCGHDSPMLWGVGREPGKRGAGFA